MSCPDCKDGLYYPLIGEPETCQTCKGEITPPPPDYCSTCEGTNYFLSHPEGTPGPCPDCKGYSDTLSEIMSHQLNTQLMPDDVANHYRRTLFGQLGDFKPTVTFVSHKLPDTVKCSVISGENNRIYPLMQQIKRQLEEIAKEDVYHGFDVSLNNSNFFNIWHYAQQAWETGVYLNIVGNLVVGGGA